MPTFFSRVNYVVITVRKTYYFTKPSSFSLVNPTFASLHVPSLEIPKQGLARIANPPRHPDLARTQRARRDVLAPAHLKEVLRHSVWVAVALLAQGKVVALGGARVALDAHEVGVAVAHAGVVAGHAGGAERVAVTS